MDNPSPSPLPNVVALESIQAHIGRKQVFALLHTYGWILDIQISPPVNKKKYGFVTFRQADSVQACLNAGDNFTASFRLKPVDATNAPLYKKPQGRSENGLHEKLPVSGDSSPSLASRLALPGDDATPPRQPSFASKSRPMSTSERGKLSDRLAPGNQEPFTSPAVNSPTKEGTSALQGSLFTDPSSPMSPLSSNSMLIDRHDRDASADNKAQAAEIVNLKKEIQKLQSSLRENKGSHDKALKVAMDDVNHYRTERNRLETDLEKAITDVDYFRNLSEDYKKERQELKTRLTLQGEAHRKHEEGLRRDIKSAREEMYRWKKSSENQTRLLSERQLELEDTRKTLHDLQDRPDAGRIQNDQKNLHRSTRNPDSTSEIEDGEWEGSDTVPGGSAKFLKPPSPGPSRKQQVISALEEAFIQLDRIVSSALQEAEHPEPYSPHKRPRRVDPS